MARTADYTIKGFLYQFNKTLLEILQCTDDTQITIEGIIEDIDLTVPSGITAIQCKYHEAKKAFTLGLIYEPVLQMMNSFHRDPSSNIKYVLFAHFPNQIPNRIYNITKDDITTILGSTNKELKKYIVPIKATIDIDAFLSCFSLEFGQSYDSLVDSVYDASVNSGMPAAEIETLSYPNAIHQIAIISTQHEENNRTITKQQFVATLREIRKTAISRWTLSLKTRRKILEASRKQLKTNLDKNARLRYFVISKSIEDFKTDIVLFISDILDKYHFKPAHIQTPLFCLDCTDKDFNDIRLRLHHKGILATDGFVGDFFDSAWFFREPMSRKSPRKEIQREFKIRLLCFQTHHHVMNDHKCDDLFIIGNGDYNDIYVNDVNVERLNVNDLKEIRYIIGVSNVYE